MDKADYAQRRPWTQRTVDANDYEPKGPWARDYDQNKLPMGRNDGQRAKGHVGKPLFAIFEGREPHWPMTICFYNFLFP